MPFGQVILGPPGSGKTTFVRRFQSLYQNGHRSVVTVNLDPANDVFPFDINISDLLSLEEVMDTFGLGPNAGLVYCMEYLEKNLDWLLDQLQEAETQQKYILFDCPGQVELFTHHSSLKNILGVLQKRDYRLCAVHLIDSFHCVDLSRYISMLLLSLQTMLQLELPHINILSKVDLMESYGKLSKSFNSHILGFNLEFYTQVQDLDYALNALSQDTSIPPRFQSLSAALTDLIQDFGLVGFQTLCIDDPESVLSIAKLIDKANGYVFGGLEHGNESLFETAIREGGGMTTQDVQDRYLSRSQAVLEQDEGFVPGTLG